MKIQPLGKLTKPEYPDYYETLRSPKLLKKNIPVSWKCKAVIMGALAAFVLAGCSPNSLQENTRDKDVKKTVETSNRPSEKEKKENEHLEKSAAFIAPVFTHGDGSAATGCVVVAFPVFLGEDEAKRIIENELGKAGIAFPEEKSSQAEVKVKKVIDYMQFGDEMPELPPENKIPDYVFKLDNYNNKTNFGFEYVSAWQTRDMIESNYHSTATEYPARERAGDLVKGLKKAKIGKNVAVFYDPLVSSDFNLPDDIPESVLSFEKRYEIESTVRRQLGKMESEKNLREQVKEFIKWAKKKGVLDKLKS